MDDPLIMSYRQSDLFGSNTSQPGRLQTLAAAPNSSPAPNYSLGIGYQNNKANDDMVATSGWSASLALRRVQVRAFSFTERVIAYRSLSNKLLHMASLVYFTYLANFTSSFGCLQ